MKFESKFNIGDVVWHAYANDGAVDTGECPECGGKGSYEIVGQKFRMACLRRCKEGRIYIYGPKPFAQQFTVGQIRIVHTDSPGKPGYDRHSNYGPQKGYVEEYMMIERGVGSGNIYRVEDLFHTEAEALERAKVLVIQVQDQLSEEEEQRERERASLERKIVREETDDASD